jgi:putative PIN family toxin of toxin-antitoxin system
VNRTEQAVVLDTNVVLDLFLFNDPQTEALRAALLQGRLGWHATPAMREELARVLDYPHIADRLRQRGNTPEALLQAFDLQVITVPAAPRASCVCKDPDDQKFIDLAVEHRACLISKDGQVLRMARRLSRLGVTVARTWGEAHGTGRAVASAT